LTALDWRADRAAKSAVIDFVERVTQETPGDYVAPQARVAVLANDHTLGV
jgi:hypothetical protein